MQDMQTFQVKVQIELPVSRRFELGAEEHIDAEKLTDLLEPFHAMLSMPSSEAGTDGKHLDVMWVRLTEREALLTQHLVEGVGRSIGRITYGAAYEYDGSKRIRTIRARGEVRV